MKVVISIVGMIGLALDIAGVVVMFRNTPHPTHKPSTLGSKINAMVENAHWVELGKSHEEKQIKSVRIGFKLLLTGFVLQFLSSLAMLFISC